MASWIKLHIDAKKDLHDRISQAMGLEFVESTAFSWAHETEAGVSDDRIPYQIVLDYCDLVIRNRELMSEIGVGENDVSLMINFEYVGQCNLEYDLITIQRLSAAGMSLLITCWEEDSIIYF